MPIYQPSHNEISFSRRSIFVDTNVLYAAFKKTDDVQKQDALTFLDLGADLLIIVPVIVETWGMLVGRDRYWEGGFEFLSWLENPGNSAFPFPQHVENMEFLYRTTSEVHIDSVDAFLMKTADEVTEQCNFSPSILIATYDFRDYLKCLIQYKMRFNLINPSTLEQFPIQVFE